MRLLTILSLSALALAVQAHSRGAPCSILSDKNLEMSPQHGRRPMTSPPPYTIVVSRDGFEANDTLRVKTYYKVSIEFDPFLNSLAGFVLRAAYDKNPGKVPPDAGKFVVSSRACARYISCGDIGSYVTHKRPRRCSAHSFVWLSPDTPGEYVFFQATGVLDYTTFWTNLRTKSYRLEPGPTTTPETTIPTTTTTPLSTTTTTTTTTTPRPTPKRTTPTFPPTTTLEPLTTPPYDPACEPDGPDCLLQLRRDFTRKFCEISGWKDYCPQLCCYKVKGESRPDFS